jgi:triosephosphate isomerase
VSREKAPAILVFPPSLSLHAVLDSILPEPRVGVGVQNIHWEEHGAFTGEISAPMARAAGATHVLVGHSERRHLFGETDQEVDKKVEAALTSQLTPVICVGETLEERRAGRLEEVLLGQLDAVLSRLAEGSGPGVLLAYEPVWAIGTGETATPEDASQAHGLLFRRLEESLGSEDATRIPILYGGSVKPENARELLEAPFISGVLVGGASLDPESFSRIVEAGEAP